MKQRITLKTSFLMLLLLFTVSTQATEAITVTIDNLEYQLNDDGTAIVSASDHNLIIGSFVIPEHVTYDEKSYRVTAIGDGAFSNCAALTSITIPNSITNIGKTAFYMCRTLVSLNIPNSVTTIDEDAFKYCMELTSITIGSGVKTIGNRAFSCCFKLPSVNIPDNVTDIGDQAFSSGEKLTSVTIGNGVTSIGADAFSKCTVLVSVNFGNNIASIGGKAFFSCSSLSSINIPATVTNIGDEAFSKCAGLTSVIIPDGVTELNYGLFADCTGLNSVTIGSGISLIKNDVFAGCTGLSRIFSLNSTPPVCYNSFSEKQAALYVPIGSKSAYQEADVWKEFSKILEFDGSTVSSLQKESTRVFVSSNKVMIENAIHGEVISISNLAGQTIYQGTEKEIELHSGIYLVKTGNTTQKVIIE